MNNQAIPERLVAPDLVEMGPAGAQIVAARRKSDGKHLFPFPSSQGSDGQYDRVLLNRRGALWTWTVQRFRPKSPPYLGADGDPFRPYYLGYVEFPEGIVVEGRIDAQVDVDRLEVGMPMETTIVSIGTDSRGQTVYTYGFKVAEPAANSERG